MLFRSVTKSLYAQLYVFLKVTEWKSPRFVSHMHREWLKKSGNGRSLTQLLLIRVIGNFEHAKSNKRITSKMESSDISDAQEPLLLASQYKNGIRPYRASDLEYDSGIYKQRYIWQVFQLNTAYAHRLGTSFDSLFTKRNRIYSLQSSFCDEKTSK